MGRVRYLVYPKHMHEAIQRRRVRMHGHIRNVYHEDSPKEFNSAAVVSAEALAEIRNHLRGTQSAQS